MLYRLLLDLTLECHEVNLTGYLLLDELKNLMFVEYRGNVNHIEGAYERIQTK